jgi:hypothetical protein
MASTKRKKRISIVNVEACTVVQVAAAIGKSRQTVHTWTKDGAPRNRDGTYSLPTLCTWREDELTRPASAEAEKTQQEVRKLRSQCSMLELELKAKRGQTVTIGELQALAQERAEAAKQNAEKAAAANAEEFVREASLEAGMVPKVRAMLRSYGAGLLDHIAKVGVDFTDRQQGPDDE